MSIGQRDWWKTLNFIKLEQTSLFPPIYNDDVVYLEDADKVNIMNEFFVDQTKLNESNASLPSDIPLSQYDLSSISTTLEEDEKILKSLKLGKASGSDLINNKILNRIEYLPSNNTLPLSFPLSDLFNVSLATDKVPSTWKETNALSSKRTICQLFLISDLFLS